MTDHTTPAPGWALALLPRFAARLARRQDDLTVLCWGDSLLAREQHTTAGGIDARALPPMMHTRRFDWWLWQALDYPKPTYHRFDYPGAFRFTGEWQAVTNDPVWDDGPHRPGVTYVSESDGASFTFTLGAHERVSLLDRTDATGAEVVLSVAGGPGRVQVRDATGIWVEADGHRFSQRRMPTGLPQRQGNTLYPRPLALRSLVTTPVAVRAGRAEGSDGRLLIWGLERHGEGPVLRLPNAARGGHTLDMLSQTMDDDVLDRRPDLIVLELPLLNMVHVCPTVDYSVGWVWDVVWGDRPGHGNDWSLAARARRDGREWQAFELLLLLPHHSQVHVRPDGAFADLGKGVTAAAIYDGVRALVAEKGGVPLVDIASTFLRTAEADGFANYYEATAPSSPDGATLTTDGVHQNDRGTRLYVEAVCRALGLALPR